MCAITGWPNLAEEVNDAELLFAYLRIPGSSALKLIRSQKGCP